MFNGIWDIEHAKYSTRSNIEYDVYRIHSKKVIILVQRNFSAGTSSDKIRMNAMQFKSVQLHLEGQ